MLRLSGMSGRVNSPFRSHTFFKRSLSVSPKLSEIQLNQLDKKWSDRWRKLSPDGSLHPTKHLSSLKDEKFYSLSMFPYPSGILHMGHLRVYTISDAIARFNRLNGRKVIHPMGWDAFGLPAENAAVERGIDPAVWTSGNISKMKNQMGLMLADFDWDREVTTCSPDYYKWTQKIFLLLYEEGLAYRKEAEINWDPIDQTVLANEQVDAEGKSWRSGAKVEKKVLEQWFLGITKYAKDLNKDLSLLTEWPEKVKLMQKHWIGQSHGAEIVFKTSNPKLDITTFTTRLDTIYSVQYIALALNHPTVVELSKDNEELQKFIKLQENEQEDSKEGFLLSEITVHHPLDNTKTSIPVFVAPYVLGSYGHGAVMGCPAHDDRDFAFWSKNQPNEPILATIVPSDSKDISKDGDIFTKKGKLNGNAGKYVGLTSKEAAKAIVSDLGARGLGKSTTQYRIRDWLISRQRYWGAPIPIIHCHSCGPVPVPDEQLPVLLPENQKISGKGNPLANMKEFYETKCPSCGGDAKRDTDTMDTFMDSSWYFFRYTDSKNKELPFGYEKATKDMPVDMYIGGVEHAIMHLLYSRFISKFLHKKGLWDGSKSSGEPIKRLVTQGMVHGKTYSNPDNGRFLKPHELDNSNPSKPLVKATGKTPLITYEKMSKSKYNGADPGECIAKHGADATRAHILFQSAVTDVLLWDEKKIVGIERWLRRVLQLSEPILDAYAKENGPRNKSADEFNEDEINLHNDVQIYTRSITESLSDTLSLNTMISDFMKLTNSLAVATESPSVNSQLLLDTYKKLLILISPVTPSVAEEGWEIVSTRTGLAWSSVFHESWPPTESLIESNLSNYSVFVNGKVRFNFEAHKELHTCENDCLDAIKNLPDVGKWIDFAKIKRVIRKPSAISIVLDK